MREEIKLIIFLAVTPRGCCIQTRLAAWP